MNASSTLPIDQLQSMLNDVMTAIGNGTLRIRRSDGSELQYRSMADLVTAKSTLETQIEIASGGGSRVGLAQTKRGDGPCGNGGLPWDQNWNGF